MRFSEVIDGEFGMVFAGVEALIAQKLLVRAAPDQFDGTAARLFHSKIKDLLF